MPLSMLMLRWQFILVSLAPVNAEARVVDRRTTTDSDGAPVYYIVYEYVVNGQRLTNQQSVSPNIYARAEQGTRLRIEYSRIAPNAARILGTGNPLEISDVLLLPFILIGLGMPVLAIYDGAKWRRRIRRAKLIKGQVLQVRTEEREDSDGDRYTVIILKVRFQTPQGRIIEGEKIYNSSERFIDDPPSTENTVAVLYVDDKDWELL